jgi:hypothetical protein
MTVEGVVFEQWADGNVGEEYVLGECMRTLAVHRNRENTTRESQE